MPPPKKKSRKGFFIVLGVILAVALVGCVGVAAMVNAGGQAAQQALNQTSTQVAQLPTIQPTTQPATKPTQASTTGTKVSVHPVTPQFKTLLRVGHMVLLKVA
jgi:flagellar basal body-associated protein FliL